MQDLPQGEMDALAQQLRSKGLGLSEHFQNDGGWIFAFENEEEAKMARKVLLE